ncbi:SusD/RagB family nutrient-binding outer membrane lipoprotein [Cyclobacterium plantarum]|uniref:SusD/RagB family nutrient-binding outer membrane lipoprotein n=1 Tax=Cyclobacterium plantarum TaxID=2716263 RepID=A0ABX0H6G2_9BACT|nr:SusD/RagB family nutrient-binding outer membrane lipoprotein [Cyclobacterium plantarum]NHE57025.1 SusD/RagB family nutrient-binding outer membrane lipoprotein [Cyclobacterium plantarum]
MLKLNFKYNIVLSLIIGSSLLLNSCSEDLLDINQDPNTSTQLALPNTLAFAQVSLVSNLLDDPNTNAGSFSRMWYTTAIRNYEQNQGTYSNSWVNLYSRPLANLQAILDGAQEDESGYKGIARLLKAYTFSLLVDLYGDVPYFEALNPEITFPEIDQGEEIYADLFLQVDQAIQELNASSEMIQGDMIYGGDKDKWIKMGNSLKLKMYAQTRKENSINSVQGFTQMLNSELINGLADDFQLKYGSEQTPNQNRHPLHVNHYNQATAYWMDNWTMANLLNDGTISAVTGQRVSYRNVQDPRLRYYIFRQVPGDGGGSVVTCAGGGCPIGLIGNGYLGRDAGDPSAFSNEGALIATFGVYPIAGLVDTDQPKTVSASDGSGRGIFPMLTSFMIKFLHAEMALTTSVEGDPLTLLREGITQSMEKVRNFGATEMPAISGSDYEMTDEAIAAYIADVSAQYEAAETESEKLNIIITEYQLALWGNGIEAYNNYRRTGFPDFAETSPVMGNPPYPQRFIIPVSELETNPALSDYSPDPFEPVFWSQP